MTEREKKELLQDFADEVLGLGPIEQLMRDKTISEVMINGPDFVFAERNGRIELTPLRFFDEEHLRNTIAKILAPTGRRVDELSPYVDARLPDGSRVNVAVPPIAVDGSLVTIRKFPDVLLSMEDLLDKNSLVEKMAVFLECAVQGRLNIFVSGGTGSGKTTLLNVLASFIPEHERIVVIEDSAELQIHKTHVNVARLEARPPNIEGRGEITIRDLVRNSLRMRPDRIVVGEVRGAEALEMLQAMNTGHDGSLSTGHGNSPEDMVNRLEAMCLTSGLDLTETVIRKMIAGGLDLIVQQSRLKDGTRKIVQIAEVADYVDGVIRLHPIWEYHPKGVDSMGRIFGRFLWTGTIPRCAKKLVDEGVPLPSEIFSN
ncbi:MAG: CpaF family protein [Candidatus Hydrogenedentota bacterium]|nr:MAG: CpaF family protein [Candidatus Hydrogenedentota bacterium]